MVHFVGAGSGAVDLITLRGKKLVDSADVVIYAGSLVNPELLSYAREDCKIYNSAKMTLDEVLAVMEEAEKHDNFEIAQQYNQQIIDFMLFCSIFLLCHYLLSLKLF